MKVSAVVSLGILVTQSLIKSCIGGFIVGKEHVPQCSGSISLSQPGSTLTLLSTTTSVKLNKRQSVLVRAEGNCCWTVHARRKLREHVPQCSGSISLSQPGST